MANQQFNVKLGFQAETSQAKKAIEDLGKSLRQIQVQPQSVFDDRALRKASQAAQDLEKHLFRATNVNTNKLDLNKFSQSLTNADQNLQSLCNDLQLAGKDGEKAFLNLIKNINKADSSTLNLGSKMEHMLKTLKNTARWELSSNIVHGFESAISNAYGYAQDLNKSLNDIRIVTGRNIDQMAQFAESANRAAKALSTTTTDYTNASLIYFQQGLSNKEVEERTNVTIKMANAAGESAQTISDQMTAVWNNFDNGTKSLEYYADVMTALGAATASSTSEISEGLNKFAAIAETVGLSYEYATAALATVTSQTRESADVVGNAYKTLFARIQGLQQGDTLDDGTTLNKYSQALKNVGIDIKDVSGDMKDMNTILDEMGAKWVTLEKDQQLALAQTVAGVRQYNQLVSLMDNWQVFQKNLTTAYTSEGTLNEQAEIYAESWEAASKRVEAAAEGIYKSLLNDEFFIDITNIFGGFISGIEDVIQGIGGLKNILLIVGSIFLKQYAKEIPDALVNLKNNFEVITGKAEKNKIALLGKAAKAMSEVNVDNFETKQLQGEAEAQKKISQMNYELAKSKKFMSQASIDLAESQKANIEKYGEAAAAIGEEIDALEKLSNVRAKKVTQDYRENGEERQKKRGKKELKKYSEDDIKIYNDMIEESKYNEQQKKQLPILEAELEGLVERSKKLKNKLSKKDFESSEIVKQIQETEQLIERVKNLPEYDESKLKNAQQIIYRRELAEKAAKGEYTEKDWEDKRKEWLATSEKYSVQSNRVAKVSSQIGTWKVQQGLLSQEDKGFEKQKEQMLNYLQELKDTNILSDDDLQTMKMSINSVADESIPNLIKAFEKIEKMTSFKEASDQVIELEENLDKLSDELYFFGTNLAEDQTDSAIVDNRVERTEEQNSIRRRMQNESLDLSEETMEIPALMGAMTANAIELWGALSMLKGLGNIWNDDSLSTGEKILQTMSALIPVFTMFGSILNENNQKQLIAIGNTITSIFTKKADTAATIGSAVATKILSDRFKELWVSMGPISIALLAIVAAMAAVALAVWGISEAFQHFKNQTPEGQLENATNRAQELNNALENAANAANELKSAFDQYDSAANALEECTKNTQEWHDALSDVNNQALSLLQTYPELATMVNDKGEKAIQYGSDGQLQIMDWAKQQLIDEANKQAITAQIAATRGQSEVRNAKVNVEKKDIRREISTSGVYAGKTGNETGESANVEVLDYIMNNIDKVSSLTPEEFSNNLQDFMNANAYIGDVDSWVDAVYDLGEDIGKLNNQIEINNAATKAENELLARQILMEEDQIADSEHFNEIAQISGAQLEAKIDAELAKLDRWGKDGINKATGVNDEAAEVFKRYAEAVGINDYDLIDTTGTDQNRNFVYTSGNEEVTVSLEAMKRAVAAYEASGQITENAEKLVASFATKATEEIAAMTAAVTEDVNDLTINQASGNFDITAFAKTLTESDLTAMGYEGDLETMRNDYIAAYNEIAAGAGEALEDIVDDYSKSIQDVMNNLIESEGLGDITLGQLDTLGSYMQDVFIKGGKDALDNFEDIFNSIDLDQKDEFINALGTIDWQTTHVRSLRESLDDVGIEASHLSDDALQKLISVMKELTTGTEAAITKYATLKEIIDGVERGGTLEPEDYDKFTQFGIDIDRFVVKTGEGLYKLIVDAEQFYNFINREGLKGFKNNIDVAQAEIKTINQLMDSYGNVENLVKTESTSTLPGTSVSFSSNPMQGFSSPYTKEQTQSQIDFLKLSGWGDESAENAAQLAEWQEAAALTSTQALALTQAILNSGYSFDDLSEKSKSNNEMMRENEALLLSSAQSMSELQNMVATMTPSEEAYTQALLSVSSGYETTAQEAREYMAVLQQLEQTEQAKQNAETSMGAIDNTQRRLDQSNTFLSKRPQNDPIVDEARIALEAQQAELDQKRAEVQNQLDEATQQLDALSSAAQSKKVALEASSRIAEQADQYDLAVDSVEDLAEAFQDLSKTGKEQYKILGEDGEAVADAAIRYNRLNEAVLDLADNYDDYKDIIDMASEATDDMDKAMLLASKDGQNLRKSLAGLLGTSEDLINADLLSAIDPDDFSKAAEGDEDAINRIRDAFIELQAEINGLDTSQIEGLKAELNGLSDGLVFDIDDTPFLWALINARYQAGATAEEIQSLLSGFNIDATVTEHFDQALQDAVNTADAASSTIIEKTSFSQEVDTTTIDTPVTTEEVGYETTITSSDAHVPTSYVLKSGDEELTPMQEVRYNTTKTVTPTIESETANRQETAVEKKTTNAAGDTAQTKGIQISNAHKSVGNSVGKSTQKAAKAAKSGKKSGGGGGSKKKADTVKKTDVVTRYKEIDDKLDDIADKMDDASKAADRLWGAARIKEMKKVNSLLEDEIELTKAKKEEAEDYLALDKKELVSLGKKSGLTFTFDKSGNISNYDEQMTKLYNELNDAITAANKDGDADDDEQDKIDAIQDRVDAITEAIEQYDETRELIEDLDNEIQDKINTWQDNNYDMLNYELEIKISIEDSKLELIDYYVNKIQDDIYKTAEAFGYMKDSVQSYSASLAAQEEYAKQLEKDYKAGKISMDAYKEGLQETQSATIENLEALQEQKEAMQDYYGTVMDLALEEIAIYTDEMEQLNSVMDHYSNILGIVGKQEDYATKKKVLNAKASNLRNEMQVQKNLYEESAAEAEKWYAKMSKATEGTNEYETYKKNWMAAQEAANEAQDAMLSKTEEWAEAMKEVVEAELGELAQTMEESLTGGTSFDELLTSMERRSSLQEEYLTTTNKIYETNKLMRQAQQEIDKSTNAIAKKKLQSFINQTDALQDQTRLSQYELDIQKAKYELLLAEIALEEARNAKSTVKLSRDSEGNFSYVYTADSDAVSAAQQELEDKQNALYNLGLEGANNYSQKYAELMQEAQDAITELTTMWMNGEIATEEEYQRRKAEIQDYYYNKLKDYSELYQIALTTDTNVIKDAWSTDFSSMIYKTDEWKIAVDNYFTGAAKSMSEWASVCSTVLTDSGLDKIDDQLETIANKSDELKTKLIGEDGESGVVGAMMSQVEAAGKLSNSYIKIQNEIDKLIEKYEKLLKKVNEDYTNPTTEVVPATDPTEDKNKNNTTTTPTTTTTTTTTTKKSITVGGKINAKGAKIYDYAGDKSGERQYFRSDPIYKVLAQDGDWIKVRHHKLSSGVTGWFKKGDVTALNTGGYTGTWEGSYGKLAFLHQKELVLNAQDTENFLTSMNVLERILKVIDIQALNSSLGAGISAPSMNHSGNEVLEQKVSIEAHFPNVNNHTEIEEAFNNLINTASQYANRKS